MKTEIVNVFALLAAIATVVSSKIAVRSSSDAIIQAIKEGQTPGQSRLDIFHNECQFEEEERRECGKRTYDEKECRARGCCWEPCEGCAKEVPWCFLAHRMLRQECAVAYEDKDDCGYYGISEGECYMRDCCWAPSPLVNDPPCFQKAMVSGIRLVNGPDEMSGRLEVMHEGEWGTVCDDGFGEEEAQVVCNSLGYRFGRPRAESAFGEGTGPILLDDLNCRGDETRLEDCPHNGWGSHNCGHYEDAGVECSDEEFDNGSGIGGSSSGSGYGYSY